MGTPGVEVPVDSVEMTIYGGGALMLFALLASILFEIFKDERNVFDKLTKETRGLLDITPLEKLHRASLQDTSLQRSDWLDFRIKPWHPGTQAVEVAIDLTHMIPGEVQLTRHEAGVPSPAWLRGPKTLTHDTSFDRKFEVRGDPLSVHAMLGKTARNQLAMLVEKTHYGRWQEVWLDRARLTARLIIDHDTEHLQASNFSKMTQDLIQVAASIAFSEATVSAKLCQEVNKLQSNLYRAWCVSHLLDHWPESPETLNMLDLCRHHGVCELQLVAFEFAPDDFSDDERYKLMLAVSAGHADNRIRENALRVLIDDYLERVFFSDDVPLFQRLLVVARLTRLRPPAEVEALLTRLYEQLEDRVRREFSRQLLEVRWLASSDFLMREARRVHTQEKTLVALCEWVAIHPPETQEVVALALLDHQRANKARSFAIRALASAGGFGALATLSRISQTTGSASQNELAREASAAITAIQTRLGEPVRGAMTLITADDAHGQLSLVQEAGGLTPVDPLDEERSHG